MAHQPHKALICYPFFIWFSVLLSSWPSVMSNQERYHNLSTACKAGRQVSPPHTLSQGLHTIIVGGYAGEISILHFDERTRKLSNLSSIDAPIVGEAPSWIIPSKDGNYLFSTNEVGKIDGRNNTGSLSSYRLSQTIEPRVKQASPGQVSQLTIDPLNRAFTAADPVFMDISPDERHIIVASYTGAEGSIYELNHDRTFKSIDKPSQVFTYNATGPNAARQSQSYIHQARYDPTGRIAAFTDLGGDRVYIHSVQPKTGTLTPLHTIELHPGTGPRHLSFVVVDEVRTDVYLICELSNEMIFIELTYLPNGSIRTDIRQILSTLPDGIPTNNTYGAGEVAVSFDGRYVYGTNRQTDFKRPETENSIVIFEREHLNGQLKPTPRFVPLQSTGATPRHISLSKDREQKWLVVVGQQANKLAVYARDPSTGGLELADHISVASPSVAQFVVSPIGHPEHCGNDPSNNYQSEHK